MTIATTSEMNEVMRRGWRDLGFYYNYDESTSQWQLVGSETGLAKFAELLMSYATDSRHEPISEHKHYGPYFYLEFMTWEERKMTDHAICGTLADFRDLSAIVRRKLSLSGAGSNFSIGDEYVPGTKTTIHFDVREEGFDPASADPLLSHDS